tara:strand:- start:663 stop:1268 length:606 start_codon:yes stop_codon:yes gene_type:complete
MAFAGTAQWRREISGLWTLLLDGNSDYASLATPNWRQEDGRGTIVCWVQSVVLTGDQTIFATSDTGTDTNFIQLRLAQTTGFLEIVQRDGGALNQITGDVACGDGLWHLCVVTGDTTVGAYILWVDDGAVGLTVTAGLNTGNWLDAVYNLRDNISVGAWINNSGTEQYFDGNLWGLRYWPWVMTRGDVWTLFNKERRWFAL